MAGKTGRGKDGKEGKRGRVRERDRDTAVVIKTMSAESSRKEARRTGGERCLHAGGRGLLRDTHFKIASQACDPCASTSAKL